MSRIIVNEIPGSLEEFLEYMEEKKDLPGYKGKIKVEPDFAIDDNTLGGKLSGVILAGAGTVVPLILDWMKSRKNKTKIEKTAKTACLDITCMDNGQTGGDRSKEILTLEQVWEALQHFDPNGEYELNIRLKRVTEHLTRTDIRKDECLNRSGERQGDSVRKILIVSSNPVTMPRLRLDKEVSEIEDGLLRSIQRGQFEIRSRLAAQYRDLRKMMLDFNPHIVHLTGHGDENRLLMEDETGNSAPVSPRVLAGLFEVFSDKVDCVILSACYSVRHAEAVKKHIKYVIGMRREIQDNSAIEFAIGFYDTLGSGRPVEEAYKLGCNAILAKFPDSGDHNVPVLKIKKSDAGSQI